MLEEAYKEHLMKEFKDKLIDPVKLIFFTQKIECRFCEETHQLLKELAELSDKIELEVYNFVIDKNKVDEYKIDKIPAIVVEGKRDCGIRFYGIPSGYEFETLVEDIFAISSGNSGLSQATKNKLKELTKPLHIQVFVTLTCPYCPQAVKLAHSLALESDYIKADMIEASEFPHLANKYNVFAVPKIVVNETVQFEGALPEGVFVEEVLKAKG